MRHISPLTRVTIFMVCCLMLSIGYSQAQEIPQTFPTPWASRAADQPRGTLDVDVVTVESDGDTIVTEFGASDTFTMALTEQPAAPIVLRHISSFEVIILPQVVTFTPENWDVPQTLTVYAHHNYFNYTNSGFYPRYTAETVVDGIHDYTSFPLLDFYISIVNTPKVIPTDPLVVTNLADSVSEEIEGSLRQMMHIANARAGADTITFQAGLNGTITLAGDLTGIGANSTIIGPGQDHVTIDGSGIYSGFTGDGITLEALTLTNMPTAVFGDMLLTDVTVTNSGEGASLVYGFPAIYGETITLNRVTMRGNSGVFGGAVASSKKLYITDSTFTDNHAVEVPFNGGTRVLGGGAIYIENEAEIEFSTFVNNTAVLGGAIYLSKWSDGTQGAQAYILDNRFHENSAGEGGAIFIDRGQAYITRSLFTANQAMDGGAINSSHGNAYRYISVSNSTFNGNLNTSPTGAAAIAGSGDIFFSTFSGHHTSETNSTGVIRADETILLINVIIAHNNEANPLECSGNIVGDNNLTNDTACSGHFAVPTGVDPVLRDNGGFTQTHTLLEGSNAIDADRILLDDPADTTGCIFLARFSELFGDTVDQRGNPRPVGRACDLGAVESDFVALLSNGSFETAASKLYQKAWERKNLLANDKRLCQSDDPSLITAAGVCVFQFKAIGTPTVGRSLKQVITGDDLGGAGETLTLSAMVEGNKFKTGAQIVVTVTYANNTTVKKNIAIPNGTYAFQEITGKLKLTKKVKKIVVNINVGKVTGRLRVDEVWLSLSDTALHDFPVDGTRDGAIDEMPNVPDGFRR